MIIQREQFLSLFGWPKVEPGVYLTAMERAVLVALARHVQAGKVVEFGVQAGTTAKVLLDHVSSIVEYIGVDLPRGGETTLKSQQNEVPQEPAAAVAGRDGFRLVLQDSRTLTAEDLTDRTDLTDRADLVFIDGGHDRETVESDTRLAMRIVRAGGVIVWHDYNAMPEIGVRGAIDAMNAQEHRCVLVQGTWLVFRFADGDASGGRGAEQAPRTPQDKGAPAGMPEYRPAAAAPLADASTHAKPANAGGADAGREPPASPPVSGADRIPGGSVGDASPRPPEASGSADGRAEA